MSAITSSVNNKTMMTVTSEYLKYSLLARESDRFRGSIIAGGFCMNSSSSFASLSQIRMINSFFRDSAEL